MNTTRGMICPRCGRGVLSRQGVEETPVVGSNAVQVTTDAEVCSFCGERWFDPAATARLDAAIAKLRAGDVSQLTQVGEMYRTS